MYSWPWHYVMRRSHGHEYMTVPPIQSVLVPRRAALYSAARMFPRKSSSGRRHSFSGAICTLFAALLLCLAGGCVERELVVESAPDGALVYMNDQEVGRTPIRRDFQWYGTYDVVVRKEGYETLRAQTPVIAPPWLW